MTERRPPFWLWPNLLSLDAPIVAVAWLYMFARAWLVDFHQWQAYIALGLSVWTIYVVDRLLDVRMRSADDPSLGWRHRFHARHWKRFIAGVLAALAILVVLVWRILPSEIVWYVIPATVLVAAFFLVVITFPASREVPHFRNILGGMTFGFGTALAAHVYKPMYGLMAMVGSREMISFGVLCVLNISAIHLWEHSRRSPDPEQKAADELSLTLPLTLLASFALVFAYLDNRPAFGSIGAEYSTRPFFYAILVSTALLYVLNRTRSRFDLDALRCLADVAMIAPLPIFLALTGR